jgi:branched-chain amino acid transport system ATP-binding protein
MLEIARALALEPKLLLLDEPASGLNARETIAMGELIEKIKQMNVTVLLVEHDMELVMDISDYVAVINFGKLIAKGTPSEIQENEDVIAAYLGE